MYFLILIIGIVIGIILNLIMMYNKQDRFNISMKCIMALNKIMKDIRTERDLAKPYYDNNHERYVAMDEAYMIIKRRLDEEGIKIYEK
jgi:hypothetical protein